jgi:hypothetical protein
MKSEAGIERTLNGTGYMITSLDPISKAFVDFAVTQSHFPALDIGAAFGVATHAALKRGVRVVANDIDPEHLEILKERTPAEHQSRLKTTDGAFPDDLCFPYAMFSSILLSRVMHFFDGQQVMRSVARLYDWLATGGKVFVVVEASLFLDKPPLRKLYENRKESGAMWPGFVNNVKELLPKRAEFLPDQLHYLDPDVLTRAFVEGGFQVEYADHFERADDPGDPNSPVRRSVGFIARKP